MQSGLGSKMNKFNEIMFNKTSYKFWELCQTVRIPIGICNKNRPISIKQRERVSKHFYYSIKLIKQIQHYILLQFNLSYFYVTTI
jgi:hypothetical protein